MYHPSLNSFSFSSEIIGGLTNASQAILAGGAWNLFNPKPVAPFVVDVTLPPAAQPAPPVVQDWKPALVITGFVALTLTLILASKPK